jgi:hypothetical protein
LTVFPTQYNIYIFHHTITGLGFCCPEVSGTSRYENIIKVRRLNSQTHENDIKVRRLNSQTHENDIKVRIFNSHSNSPSRAVFKLQLTLPI